MRVNTAILLLALTPLVTLAETAYVTDQLRLGLHRAADTSDRSFRTLESGQEMEVLSRDRNYANVQLPDGTIGYVKAAYLVDDKPAKLIVAESQAETARLQQELSRLQASFAQPAATIASLEQRLEETATALTSSESQVVELQEQNDEFVDRYSAYKFSLPLKWVAGALLVTVLAGFLGGLWWTDYRSRKRHGGIRIY